MTIDRDMRCGWVGVVLIAIAVLGFVGLVLFGCGGVEDPPSVTGWGVGDTMIDEQVMGYLPAGGRCAGGVPGGALTSFAVSSGGACASTGWWVVFDGANASAVAEAVSVKPPAGVEVVRVRFQGASGEPETPAGLAAWAKSAQPSGPVALDPSLKFGPYFPRPGPILHLVVDLQSLRILGAFDKATDAQLLFGGS